MKILAAAVASLSLMVLACAKANKTATTPGSNAVPPSLTPEDVRAVSPTLERYTQDTLNNDLWKRPDLSPRDRSVITVAALIARNQLIEMPYHFPPASGALLPIGEAAEAQRGACVEQDVGPVAPGVVKYTSDLLFHDLWLRPALAPRDRSLVTVSALIASGQVAQIPYHLNKAMDNGLTKAEASEALTHLAFYAGWPNVFSAIPVVKGVFEKRPG